MSVDLIVYLARSNMLTPTRWADAIRSAGFAVELDTDFDVDQFTGFLPCRLDGADSGFEYAAAPLTDDERNELASAFDFSVVFTTHSDMQELKVSTIAAAVLAQATGGLVSDPQSGETIEAAAALEWARASLAEMDDA